MAMKVDDHIANPGAVRWMRVDALRGHACLHCVDGRDTTPVLGTPGGDAGEILLGLAVIEKITGKALSHDTVNEVIRQYTSAFGRCYMHTDTTALQALTNDLAADPKFADVGMESLEVEALVRDPGARAQALLPHLLEPAHIGCGHLKLILSLPERYGVRAELTRSFLSAVFEAMWDGKPIYYVVLPGAHAERAVVNIINSDDALSDDSKVSAVAPCLSNSQIFVNHPQVVGWVRGRLRDFLFKHISKLKGQTPEQYDAVISELAQQQLMVTLEKLASGFPIVNATLTLQTETVGHAPTGD